MYKKFENIIIYFSAFLQPESLYFFSAKAPNHKKIGDKLNSESSLIS